MDPDESTVRCVLDGDAHAFRDLVLRHQASVCATIRALRPHSTDWEDLAQDAFVSAYRHLATFDARKGTFRTWLLAIARNHCRTASARPSYLSAAVVHEAIDDRTPDRLAMESECFERLDAGLAGLPEEQRLTFVLVELQGFSHQEAAEASGVAVGTVKSRLSRAREWMREVLHSWSDKEKQVALASQIASPETGGRR